jgi:hypothetical protein
VKDKIRNTFAQRIPGIAPAVKGRQRSTGGTPELPSSATVSPGVNAILQVEEANRQGRDRQYVAEVQERQRRFREEDASLADQDLMSTPPQRFEDDDDDNNPHGGGGGQQSVAAN